MRILVVEDEKISRLYLSSIAEKFGDTDTAQDGEDAARKIRDSFETRDRYDIIFLDIMLPKMTGHKVLELIRGYEKEYEISEEEKSRVIITSALKDSENVKMAYDNLADGYIVKPIFKTKIEEILDNLRR